MIKPNPFTPKSGQEPKVFVNREKEIGFFRKKVVEVKQGPTNHYVVNGEWSCGEYLVKDKMLWEYLLRK